MRLLMKFGGTSVGDGDCIQRVIGIVEPYHTAGDELAVVVSACSGVTDQIIAVANEMVNSKEHPPIETFLHAMRTRHLKILEQVAPDFVDEVTAVLDDRLAQLQNILAAVYTLKELTPRSRDYIITFGERFSAPIVGAALRQQGIPSVVLDGVEAGIITTANHGDARALPESANHIKSRVGPLLADSVPVIMGFMGATGQGVITTLGRSGSDYSAAIIGAGIDADEIWIWTDVDGVMTSDPRIVKDARVLTDISYLEMMELSYFGAKVLHPRSVEPAMQKDLPVRVKNTFNPDHPGTLVLRKEHREKRVVKAISLIEKVALININGAQMIGRPGVARTIFSALAEKEANVMMISQGSSEANISLIIDESHLDAAVEALSPIAKQGIVREVTYDRNIAAVAVVGAGMAGTPGTGGRIFAALGRAGINVMMISQGSSEVNVSFVVKGDDGKVALQVLHDEFRLSEDCDD
jgi:aspartate kinase